MFGMKLAELIPAIYEVHWVPLDGLGTFLRENVTGAQRSATRLLRGGFWVTLGAALLTQTFAQDSSRRFEDFTSDPQWESYRSRLLPNPLPITRQNFGWRDSSLNGARGEIGGWIQRSLTPASIAKVIPERTLNDRFSASGKF